MALAVLLPLAVSSALAADPTAPISTDRPSVTDSSIVVPAGALQFENGLTETSFQGQNTFDVPETLLRIGVSDKTELRLSAPDYFSGTGLSGFGDFAIGFKQQIGPTHGFDLSVVAALSFPTGAGAISSHGYDPYIQVPWSRGLSKNWTAGGMFSVYSPSEAGRRNVTGESTFLIDRQLSSKWDAFAEYAGDFPEYGGVRHVAHFGTSYKLAAREQIDFHFGVGLSPSAPDHFVGVGYSFRFQAFHL